MNNDELKAGIDMRIALLAHAARAGGDLMPREAEFFEAGYTSGAAAFARTSDGLARAPLLNALNAITALLMSAPTELPDDDGEVFQAGKAAGVVQYHAEMIQYIHRTLVESETTSASAAPSCGCIACQGPQARAARMVLCPTCGNKRCPHANDHANTCTGSNEPGQPGSAYPHQERKPE